MDTIIRGVSIYVALLVVIRLSGRRTLWEMTSVNFVLLPIVAETTQQALLGGFLLPQRTAPHHYAFRARHRARLSQATLF